MSTNKTQKSSADTFPDLASWLDQELLVRREKNPNYSLRAFANFLQIDASSLSKYISGKRNPSDKTIEYLCDKLKANKVQRSILTSKYLMQNPESLGKIFVSDQLFAKEEKKFNVITKINKSTPKELEHFIDLFKEKIKIFSKKEKSEESYIVLMQILPLTKYTKI